jgi:hypothetical protein
VICAGLAQLYGLQIGVLRHGRRTRWLSLLRLEPVPCSAWLCSAPVCWVQLSRSRPGAARASVSFPMVSGWCCPQRQRSRWASRCSAVGWREATWAIGWIVDERQKLLTLWDAVDSAKTTSELESGDPKNLSGLSCYRNKEVVA